MDYDGWIDSRRIAGRMIFKGLVFYYCERFVEVRGGGSTGHLTRQICDGVERYHRWLEMD